VSSDSTSANIRAAQTLYRFVFAVRQLDADTDASRRTSKIKAVATFNDGKHLRVRCASSTRRTAPPNARRWPAAGRFAVRCVERVRRAAAGATGTMLAMLNEAAVHVYNIYNIV